MRKIEAWIEVLYVFRGLDNWLFYSKLNNFAKDTLLTMFAYTNNTVNMVKCLKKRYLQGKK